MQPLLEMRSITKTFPGVKALDEVNLTVMPGEIHALVGENGAGKSTLMKVLSGVYPTGSYEGEIHYDGKLAQFRTIRESESVGIIIIHQELALIPLLSIAENLFLGNERAAAGIVDWHETFAQTERHLARVGLSEPPSRLVGKIGVGKQQLVEIAKALAKDVRLLILDEPTASLSEHDSQILLDLVRRLKAQGTAIIYVTHRMHEIPAIGDRVTVLRDGQLIDTVPADTPEDDLIRLMTGRQMSKVYPEPCADLGDVRLRIDNVTTARQSGHVQVKGASLTVRAGEIVGIAGLVGCGKSELAQAAFGLHFLEEGSITVDGRTGRASHPSVAIRNKVWYLPSDRRLDGLSMMRSARENMALSSYCFGPLEGNWVKRSQETRILEELARHVDFDIGKLDDPVASLSGGNQQKVLLAKAMVQDISVYVLDEPTVGVDIGACLSIYRALAELSASGAAILIVSSNLPELMGLTHRLMVMSDGRFVAEFQRDEYDEHRILEQFF